MSVRLLLEADLICGLGVVSYFAASVGCGDVVISWSTAFILRWHFDAVADHSIGLHLLTFLQVAGRLVG